jgi:type IV pilus assembly protein PilC
METEYEYKAIDVNGNLVTGFKKSSDEISLGKDLVQEKLKLISAEPTTKFSGRSFMKKFDNFGRISEHDKIIMYRNLASMLEAGLPLTRALSVMYRQTKNNFFRKVLAEIGENVKKGSSLSDSLQKFPKVFNTLMTSMVRAGEESGNLVGALRVTSEQMEKTYLLKKKVQGAMVYPSFIIAAILIIGFFMMIYVVPVLTSTFRELEIELPVTTKIIIGISDFLQNNFIITSIFILILVTFIIWFLKTTTGKKLLDFVVIKLPGISTLVKEINSARATRTLSSLLASGVSFMRSLEITKDVIQNSYYKKVFDDAMKNTEEGSPISKVFAENQELFPAFVSEMMQVGEETGEFGQMLVQVANFYETEVDQKMKSISTIVEPALMIIVGAAVGFFALSMISPIYNLAQTI